MSTMKHFSKTSLIGNIFATIVVLLTVSVELPAQDYVPTPVTISTNKIKVDGELCYSHIVLERQTLYSICKAYGVTVEDLYRLNPGLEENGPKKNGIIIIPIKEQEEAPKEAVKSVAKALGGKHIKHTVKWYENIDDIAEKYGVSSESIIQLNQLKDNTLTARQRILIPDRETILAMEQGKVAEQDTIAQADTLLPSEDTIRTFAPKEDVTIALLLPMEATGSSSKRNYMDFYSGILLGVYDSANKGIGTELRVHDIVDGNLPERKFFEGCDVAIGPVYKGNISSLLKTGTDSTFIVSPLDQKVDELIPEHSSLIQAPTEKKEQYRDLVEWMKEEKKETDSIIYIRETNARDTLAVNAMVELLENSGMKYTTFSYNILQGRDITDVLLAKMSDSGTNRFIIESESEAWVNDVVRNINLLKKEKDVVLYSPSRIRSFETIEAEYFHNISLHVSLSYDIDYNAEDVRLFITKYRALFMTEPTQFAYQGYDLATYFINLISKYGDGWEQKLSEEEGKMLQATFRFIKEGDGGYRNLGIRRVQYNPDGSIENIK